MAYRRFNRESDVYVYPTDRGVECCACTLGPPDFPTFFTITQIRDHFRNHEIAGDKLGGSLESLITEIWYDRVLWMVTSG